MKYLLIISFYLSAIRQTPDPVKWSFSSKKINADTCEIHMKATIAKGWYLYSQFNEGGPGPSSFHFEKNKMVKMLDDVREVGKMQYKYEKMFDAKIREYSTTVEFIQKVGRKDSGDVTINGVVKYISCNGKLCLPPKELPFSVQAF